MQTYLTSGMQSNTCT